MYEITATEKRQRKNGNWKKWATENWSTGEFGNEK